MDESKVGIHEPKFCVVLRSNWIDVVVASLSLHIYTRSAVNASIAHRDTKHPDLTSWNHRPVAWTDVADREIFPRSSIARAFTRWFGGLLRIKRGSNTKVHEPRLIIHESRYKVHNVSPKLGKRNVGEAAWEGRKGKGERLSVSYNYLRCPFKMESWVLYRSTVSTGMGLALSLFWASLAN